MAQAKPNSTATNAASAMVLYMIFPFAFVLLRTRSAYRPLDGTSAREVPGHYKKIFASGHPLLPGVCPAIPLWVNAEAALDRSLAYMRVTALGWGVREPG